MLEQQVRINGKLFLYREKAPFIPSGLSVQGALEYDAEEDRVRCHECGRWLRALGTHLRAAHSLTAREYKIRHGLNLGAALVGESVRESALKAGKKASLLFPGGGQAKAAVAREANKRAGFPKPKRIRRLEEKNERGRCQAQVLAAIQNLAETLGHTPTRPEMNAHGISHNSVYRTFGCKDMASVMTLAGLRPNKRLEGPRDGRPRMYSPEQLIEMLRDCAAATGRIPSFTDMRRGMIPPEWHYRRPFGGFKKALVAAGIAKKREVA